MVRYRVFIVALLMITAGSSAGAGDSDERSSSSAASGSTAWKEQVAGAATALGVGDYRGAAAAIDALQILSPGNPVPGYFRARLMEATGSWDEGLRLYRRILTTESIELTEAWVRLISGRWVRCERAYDARRVREWVGSGGQEAEQRGRCLVLPPEVLLLQASSPVTLPELEALASSAAAWVIVALRQADIAEPLSLHATALLTRGTGSSAAVVRTEDGLAPVSEEAIPPITTTLGITQRLARLEPAGAPPWASNAEQSAYYLDAPPSSQWTVETERALAHFQREHGLAPTGMPDPQTRQAVERAYRQTQARLKIWVPSDAGTDPSLSLARLVGAEAVLTGTLEPLVSGGIAWSLVWISGSDGSLLCDPLSGVLAETHFEEAWTHMLEVVVGSSPFCARSPVCGELSVPPAPAFAGAVLYGRALLSLEAGSSEDAARLFGAAAKRGAGEGARWYARAWSSSLDALDRLEQKIIDREIFGPLLVQERFLRAQRMLLAGGLLRRPPECSTASVGLRRDPSLSALPEQGWIRIIGRME